MVTVALAGDTMLGRGVAEAVSPRRGHELFAPEVVELASGADASIVGLECCISARGEPWPDPRKPFFFRAPPQAADALAQLGVDCVSLANNHALDFGPAALEDTFTHLERVGVGWVGAGPDVSTARRAKVLGVGDLRLAVVAMADHPQDFAAAPGRPGTAYADLRGGVPGWVHDTIAAAAADADAVLVSPHWGPNMVAEPVPHVRAAAPTLLQAGATLVAGHSAHVFHGVHDRILYDLGDFIDDYRVDPALRNDLGLLWLVELDRAGPVRLDAVPLTLDFCHTRLATGDDWRWVRDRFTAACAAMGTEVGEDDGRLVVRWR